MPPDRREKNYQFKTFFLADKGSRGTSSKYDLPALFRVRPVDTSVQGGKYNKKKIPSTSTTPVNGDKKKPCRKYIPLFGVLLNIYPRCKRSPRFDVCAYVCLIVSGNRECSGVAQLPRLIFHILNLPHFSSFQVFCLHIKVNNNNLSTFQTGKIHENFQYLFNEIRGQFQNFPPRRRGPGRGLGGLYSIECPRIGGKKTISLKRFFSPTRAPAGPQKICFMCSLSREARGKKCTRAKIGQKKRKINQSISTSSVS